MLWKNNYSPFSSSPLPPLPSSSPETQPRGLPVVWCHWKAHPAARWSYQVGDRVPEKRCPVGMSLVVGGHVATQGRIWAALWNPKKGRLWERREGEGEGAGEGRRELSRYVLDSTGRYVSMQRSSDQSSDCLGNRCALAAEQDVVRGRTRGERAWSSWEEHRAQEEH